ncbi:exonuclease domain-containing protein [Tessaracoccus sp. Z1128]
MIWPFRRTNAAAAAKVPEGALRRFLTTEPQPRHTPLAEVALLAMDFETTGLTPGTDHLLSVGMVDVTGLSIPMGTATNFYVNPGQEVGQSAVIHQITDDELADAVTSAEAVEAIFDRLTGRVLLAHHAAIEVGFLTAAVRRLHGVSIDVPAVDTMVLGHRALGFDEDHPRDALRLWKLRSRAGLPRYRGHDAVVDALACAELYLALAQELGVRDLGHLLRLS